MLNYMDLAGGQEAHKRDETNQLADHEKEKKYKKKKNKREEEDEKGEGIARKKICEEKVVIGGDSMCIARNT